MGQRVVLVFLPILLALVTVCFSQDDVGVQLANSISDKPSVQQRDDDIENYDNMSTRPKKSRGIPTLLRQMIILNEAARNVSNLERDYGHERLARSADRIPGGRQNRRANIPTRKSVAVAAVSNSNGHKEITIANGKEITKIIQPPTTTKRPTKSKPASKKSSKAAVGTTTMKTVIRAKRGTTSNSASKKGLNPVGKPGAVAPIAAGKKNTNKQIPPGSAVSPTASKKKENRPGSAVSPSAGKKKEQKPGSAVSPTASKKKNQLKKGSTPVGKPGAAGSGAASSKQPQKLKSEKKRTIRQGLNQVPHRAAGTGSAVSGLRKGEHKSKYGLKPRDALALPKDDGTASVAVSAGKGASVAVSASRRAQPCPTCPGAKGKKKPLRKPKGKGRKPVRKQPPKPKPNRKGKKPARKQPPKRNVKGKGRKPVRKQPPKGKMMGKGKKKPARKPAKKGMPRRRSYQSRQKDRYNRYKNDEKKNNNWNKKKDTPRRKGGASVAVSAGRGGASAAAAASRANGRMLVFD